MECCARRPSETLSASLRWLALLLHAGRRRADRALPDDCSRVVWEYGAQGWHADHPGVAVDADGAARVVLSARSAYPALWSSGVRLREGKVVTVEFRLQNTPQDTPDAAHAKAALKLDDRHCVGLIDPALCVPNDYPQELGAVGRLLSFEMSGRLVFDEDSVVDVCDLDVAAPASVALRIFVDDRLVAVYVNSEVVGTARFPDAFDVARAPLLHPFAVLNAGGDAVLPVNGTAAPAPAAGSAFEAAYVR
eukprot:TRINITY_DN30559_c0_g1_i1.p1 TRINITY_DN30559_c0_g1~~TRINITY_DN30559_c0_g1_i1.p1  ORF type:complete len:249 (+),score=65.06 TRINITY_DN30559_c0_g1_i1:37-783(+)